MARDDSPIAGSGAGEAPLVPGTDSARPPSRLSTRIAGAILLLILLTPAIGFWWLRSMAREAVERSALNHTRDMLIRHMARTRGQWPRSWKDLAPDFEPADAGYGTPDVETLQAAVRVDFDFDPASVDGESANHKDVPRVLWLREHTDTDDVREANMRVLEVLRQRRR